MSRRVLLLVVSVMLGTVGVANAHHSFAATYREDESVMLEGELVAFLYRNPHSFVHVMAPDAKGVVQRWSIEWGAVAQLNRQGVDRYTLKPGDHVLNTGTPSRTADDHQLLMRKLVRPSDGFTWAAQVN
jgi:hypothetical protein